MGSNLLLVQELHGTLYGILKEPLKEAYSEPQKVGTWL